MKIKKSTFILLFFTYCTTLSARDATDKGKEIFTARCASCHSVNTQIVGPALANVDQRHPVDWIISFVHSPQAMIKKNDKDAVELYAKFNNVMMPDHPDLSADDIKNVIAYIKAETKSAPAEAAPFAKPGKLVPNYYPISLQKNYGFFITYLFSVLVFVLLLIFAVNIKDMQRK